MIVEFKKDYDLTCNITEFSFTFIREPDDHEKAKSYNAGRNEIFMSAGTASFKFNFDVKMPHNDLIMMAALKIIAPYIGSRVILKDRPVSAQFESAAMRKYPNIKEMNMSPNILPRKVSQNKYAISFSGGEDSLAVANLCSDENLPLILSARTYHPELGVFEPWYNTNSNIETLKSLDQNKFYKIVCYSDFEFVSTNKKYCIYSDNYAFTTPAILLADHLSLSGILVGDVMAAFNADETKDVSFLNFNKLRNYYASVGLDIDSPIKGLSEFGSMKINLIYGNHDISTSCQYGSFKKPCMKCIKCFRKTLIEHYLQKTKISETELKGFNESQPVINFVKRATENINNLHLRKTYALLLKDIDLSNFNNLNNLKKLVLDNYDNRDYGLLKLNLDVYSKSQSIYTSGMVYECLLKLLNIFETY